MPLAPGRKRGERCVTAAAGGLTMCVVQFPNKRMPPEFELARVLAEPDDRRRYDGLIHLIDVAGNDIRTSKDFRLHRLLWNVFERPEVDALFKKFAPEEEVPAVVCGGDGDAF